MIKVEAVTYAVCGTIAGIVLGFSCVIAVHGLAKWMRNMAITDMISDL